MEYGIQLYSVRDLSKESLEEALRQVAEIGYKFVEGKKVRYNKANAKELDQEVTEDGTFTR